MLGPTRPVLIWLVCCGSLLAGCTGNIDDGRSGPGSPKSGAPPGGGPGGKGTVATDAPHTCGTIGPSPLHRLTRAEYDNTIKDLVGQDLQLAKAFAFDERAGEFTANYFTPITAMEFNQYGAAAEAVSKAVSKVGGISRLACRRHAEDRLDLELSLDAHERLYHRVAGE